MTKRIGLGAVVLASVALAAPGTASAKQWPSLSAESAILIEPSSGDVIYSRNPYSRHEIASTTKMMTALLVLEKRSLQHHIRVTNYHPSPAESTAGLKPGERLTTADMVRALLLASANEAAASIAVDVGGSQDGFVRMMNARARRAGLRRTHFSNAIGLDSASNYSTARDLASLGILLRRNWFARLVMARSKATLESGSHKRVVQNRDNLIGSVPWMNGIKTGHTSAAGYLLVGGASRDGAELISVVTGERSEAARNADTLKLMRFGFGRYHLVRAVSKGQRLATVAVTGESSKISLVAASGVDVVMRVGHKPQVVLSSVPAELAGPIAKGAHIGYALVRREGKVVDRVTLVAATAVAAPSVLALGGSWGGPIAGLFGIGMVLLLFANLKRRRSHVRRAATTFNGPA